MLLKEVLQAFRVMRKRLEYEQKYSLNILSPPFLYCTAKRAGDFVLSFLVCLLVLPLLYIILGLIIKFTSKGPVIYKQKRLGLFGKKFTCYKFRSMYNESGPEKVVCRDDPRITPIGRFIRRTHMDEFPQFFNVLKGDMSLVGPRPLSDREVKKFNQAPESYVRLLLRPGITGAAQVKSSRLLLPEEILKCDVDYVVNPSLVDDLRLIFQTLKFSDVTY